MSMVFGLFDNSQPQPQRASFTDLDELEDDLPDIDSIGLDDDLDDLDSDDDGLDDDVLDIDFEEV